MNRTSSNPWALLLAVALLGVACGGDDLSFGIPRTATPDPSAGPTNTPDPNATSTPTPTTNPNATSTPIPTNTPPACGDPGAPCATGGQCCSGNCLPINICG